MARRTKTAKKTKAKRTVTRPSYKALYESTWKTAVEAIEERDSLRKQLEAAKNGPEFYWRTRDGRTLMPRDMDEPHLRNTVSFLQRRIVCLFGTATYVDETRENIEALAAMLKETKARGIRV